MTIIDFKAQMTVQRETYIEARNEDETATWIPIDMFTPVQRAYFRKHGMTVSLWYGQPSIKWVHNGYEWRVCPDSYAWTAGGCQVDTDAYRKGYGHTCYAAPTLKGVLEQVRAGYAAA